MTHCSAITIYIVHDFDCMSLLLQPRLQKPKLLGLEQLLLQLVVLELLQLVRVLLQLVRELRVVLELVVLDLFSAARIDVESQEKFMQTSNRYDDFILYLSPGAAA